MYMSAFNQSEQKSEQKTSSCWDSNITDVLCCIFGNLFQKQLFVLSQLSLKALFNYSLMPYMFWPICKANTNGRQCDSQIRL